MTTPPRPPTLSDTLSATGALGALLLQLAGLSAGLAAIGLYVGWREASSYFSTLGAPWVVETLPPGRLIHKGAGPLGAMAMGALLSVYALAQASVSARGLRRLSLVLGLIGFALLAGSTVLREQLGPSHQYLVASLSSYFLSLSVGVTLGELVALLADGNLKWTGYMVSLVQFVVLFGILYAPSQVGTARAEMHLDPASTSLPKVLLASTQPSGAHEWRLVAALEGTVLLLV